jgi:anthranilate phosphoribosyltransferase
MRDMLVLNVAVCLYLLDAAPDLPAAVEQARAAVAAGVGRALIHA